MTILKHTLNGKHTQSTVNNPDLEVKSLETSSRMEAITQWLVEKLAEKLELNPEEIDLELDLTDSGLSSIEAVNLSGDLENFLGCRLPPTLLWDYPNIGSLAQYLANNMAHNIGSQRGSKVDDEVDYLSSSSRQDLGNIPPEYYCFELSSEYKNLEKQLAQIEGLGQGNPFFKPQERLVNNTTLIEQRELINYATYNYIGMSGDVAVSQAAKAAIDLYGTSVSASRLVSGEKPLHRELELKIANFLGTEDSIVYVGGHATNVTTISHLFGQNDLILYDELSHNSILQGCFVSGASITAFSHNNTEELEQILEAKRCHYQKVLIVIEGIYSTDGDIANLPRFIELKKKYQTFLMVDEAHSIGVLGKHGKGIGEFFGVNPQDVDLWMGTLSKSFASCGGYIAGSKPLVKYLKYTAPGFVFSVGISPPNAAASLAAIQVLEAEPERVTTLQEKSKLFLDLAKDKGLNTGLSEGSPVIPIIVGDALKSVQLSQNLFKCGINVPFMIYPSVPKNAARLRFFLTCMHREEQIKYTVETLSREFTKINN